VHPKCELHNSRSPFGLRFGVLRRASRAKRPSGVRIGLQEGVYERVEELAIQGHHFRNFVEREGCWYWEIFRVLKGQSRVIALADNVVQKTLVLAVPHRFLVGQPEQAALQEAPSSSKPVARERRPRDCPF
jgi:hypothetical protein